MYRYCTSKMGGAVRPRGTGELSLVGGRVL